MAFSVLGIVNIFLEKLRVFESSVLSGLLRPDKEDVTGGLRKYRNEELHNLYSSPNNIRVSKLRRLRWAGHVAGMGEMRNADNHFWKI
jgi:hypothetical protein